MMSILGCQHSIPDTGAESTRPDSRLVFPPSPTAHGVLDGGWWPRTRDPAAELPALITAVTERWGVVGRIALNADAWDTRPQRITTLGQQVVRLDWFGACDGHTIRLIGCDSSHLDLLVIPPDTATVLALACLRWWRARIRPRTYRPVSSRPAPWSHSGRSRRRSCGRGKRSGSR
jgi:hypothetical protein